MEDLDTAMWSAAARPCPSFILDAGIAVPAYVPNCLLPEGLQDAPKFAPVSLPVTAGFVLTADATGREAELIEHYAHVLHAAAGAGWRGDTLRPHSCVEVNILLILPGEHCVVIDMFGAAQLGADAMLQQLADPATVPAVIYDNLDQGWALRVLIRPADVIVLEWDWEQPATAETVRALRLPRAEVARQAAAARQRLQALHSSLKIAVGMDLWNIPKPPDTGTRWRRMVSRRIRRT